MIEISDRKLMDFTMRFAETVRPVLVEHTTHSDGTMAGFTDNYLKVRIDASPEQANTVVDARLSPAPKDSEFPEELIATQLSRHQDNLTCSRK